MTTMIINESKLCFPCECVTLIKCRPSFVVEKTGLTTNTSRIYSNLTLDRVVVKKVKISVKVKMKMKMELS